VAALVQERAQPAGGLMRRCRADKTDDVETFVARPRPNDFAEAICWRVIFSQNRFPLLRITR
jgi:hypothetical protein